MISIAVLPYVALLISWAYSRIRRRPEMTVNPALVCPLCQEARRFDPTYVCESCRTFRRTSGRVIRRRRIG